MDETRFYKKPRFYIFAWSLFWASFYIWQVRRMGGFLLNLYSILFDIVIFGAGMIVWLAFFAQFVLPVSTFRERQKIFDRLISYMSSGHGPAIFIENGRLRESKGESLKKGPGVLWLDSASAAVTRTATSFKQTIGPGVHFTDKGEYIASTVDLHAQAQSIGPRETENPFAAKKEEEQSTDEYREIQNRRMQVSAWTRDGIEIVPNISVAFKIDADPAKDEDPGSRFGFDAEAVRKAITGEGINPSAPSDTPRRRVAWNQLPALIAADLWREYLSKYTLAELFEASQSGPRPKPPSPVRELVETQAVDQSFVQGSGFGNALAGMLHVVNHRLALWADKCEFSDEKVIKSASPKPKPASPKQEEPKPETALQTINRMIRARMTEVEVDILNDSGKPGQGMLPSPEYDLLKRRGIKVMSASVGNLRFPPNIEDQLVRQWSTTWLVNAKAERDRIDRQRGFIELDGQSEAALQYTQSLSHNLITQKPDTPKEAVKNLMLRSRDELVKDSRMHRRASMEREQLEELIQWVERNGI